jgi:NADPH-dependent ferric siderophore reductase
VFVVVAKEQLSPRLVRLHLGGPGFEQFFAGADPEKLATTDKYVKMLFARPELGLEPPYDLDALRETLPIEDLPVRRTYTMRSVDSSRGSIAVDIVIHGDEGVAGPWASSAQIGDVVALSGPGGQYRPAQDTDAWRLIAGDDSAIPAIASALEALPATARGLALIEVDGPGHELEIDAPSSVEVRWLHRAKHADQDPLPYGSALVTELESIAPHTGPTEVFIHGEREAMKRIATLLRTQWGIERRAMSLSAYWAAGRSEDAFQSEKRAPVGAIFAD